MEERRAEEKGRLGRRMEEMKKLKLRSKRGDQIRSEGEVNLEEDEEDRGERQDKEDDLMIMEKRRSCRGG